MVRYLYLTHLIFFMNVECPRCHHTFTTKQKRGSGASYAKTWTRLPESCLEILLLWRRDSSINTQSLTKEELYNKLTEGGLRMKLDPFFGRTSELLGFGSIEVIKKETIIETRDGYRTKKIPHYRLVNNYERI